MTGWQIAISCFGRDDARKQHSFQEGWGRSPQVSEQRFDALADVPAVVTAELRLSEVTGYNWGHAAAYTPVSDSGGNLVLDDGPTKWIEQIAEGNEEAAQRLWETYYDRLVGLVRKKLADTPRRVADEDDVVLSAFNSFCRRAADGEFPKLADGDGLWRLFMTIANRKAVAYLRYMHRQKRGGGAVRGESAFAEQNANDSQPDPGIEQVASPEPTPEFAAQMAEQCEVLFKALDDSSLRVVAVMKLEGFNNEEIGQSLECSIATVERKLARVRKKWERRLADDQ